MAAKRTKKRTVRMDFISAFPEMFSSYFSESIIKRAVRNKILDLRVHDLRRFATDKHRTVDDRPYGGGKGMVYMVGPIHRALKSVSRSKKMKRLIVLTDPAGKKFDHKMAKKLASYDQLVFVCPRYEGVDARVRKLVDVRLSIGDYVLTGGELPAMVMADAVARQVPGVIPAEALAEETHSVSGYEEYPQYTRPESYDPGMLKGSGKKPRPWNVPSVLLSGDHAKIREWRDKRSGKGGARAEKSP